MLGEDEQYLVTAQGEGVCYAMRGKWTVTWLVIRGLE